MNTASPAYHIITGVLRVALVVALIWAGWAIYRKLPADASTSSSGRTSATSQTSLLIVMRGTPEDNPTANVPVELYPIDVVAARDEYLSEPHAGVRWDDFLARRMNGRAPVKSELDGRGHASVMLTPGKWWIHVTLAGAENIEWRLPVNVYGRQQTVELTSDNAYARTKTF